MKHNIPDFNTTRVLVIGDLMLDRYWYGGTGKISPEAPVPVVHVGEQEDRAGGAGNVATNLSLLGCSVDVLGFCGNDEAGQELQSRLQQNGCNTLLQVVDDVPTITKLRVISRNQQLLRLDFEQGFENADHALLEEGFQQQVEYADVVILSDYAKGCLTDPQSLIQYARSQGKKVIVDPKQSDYSIYRGATLLTPNMVEFEAVAGVCMTEQDLLHKGQQFLLDYELESLLVTRSEKGMLLFQRDVQPLQIAARSREVYDVTGAGDTVVAVVAAVLSTGQTMAQACELANLAAGVVVAKLGTATVSVSELKQVVAATTTRSQGVVDEENLLRLVGEAQSLGKKVVMTNGCFDLLHPGHVNYLQQAAELGDFLIVAVNDDASVARLKGSTRPLNALEKRMQVLSGLRSVDWVTPFSADTPEDLICNIKPDYLVKGGDYRAEDLAGYQCVQECGGEVVILGYEPGCSTTELIGQIQKQK